MVEINLKHTERRLKIYNHHLNNKNIMIIPVITLKQPWASWVMEGLKLIESRTHTQFKSLEGKTFCIHSAKKYDLSDYVLENPYLTQEKIDASLSYPVGVILGTVHCTGYLELHQAHELNALIECRSIQRYGLCLKIPKKFKNPIPETGELSIWYYDLEERKKVKKQTKQIELFI